MSPVEEVRRALLDAYRAALAAVDPAAAVRRSLPRFRLPTPVTVLALGKAAPAMARSAVEVLGDGVGEGLVVSDHAEEVPAPLHLVVGGHPVSTEASVRAGEALLEAADRASGSLLVLVSGGGSALAEAPREGVGLADVAAVQRLLLEHAVPIEQVNLVRRHLSRLKDGGLLRAARVPAVTLILSDVVDADPSAVASGPTLADGSSPAGARSVLEDHDLTRLVPPSILEALARPRTGDGPPPDHRWEVVGDHTLAAKAARDRLTEQGWAATIDTTSLRGRADEEARRLLARLEPGFVAVAAGETTVEVTGAGSGGRNQHAALAAAIAIDGREAVFAALGTDGRDGPTDAAGAVADGGTAGRILASGIDPGAALAACDSHPALDAAGALVRTGLTGTNVGDLWMAWASA